MEFFGADKTVFASDAPFDPEKGPMYIRETIKVLAPRPPEAQPGTRAPRAMVCNAATVACNRPPTKSAAAPRMRELGQRDLVVDTLYGLFAPAKTPREVVDRLNAEVNELLELPDIRAALARQGLAAVTDKPEMNARMQFQSIVLAGGQGHIVFMDDAEVQANVSWQNYERSWNLWKTRALARLEAEKAAAA